MKKAYVSGLLLVLVSACGIDKSKPAVAPAACSKSFVDDLASAQNHIDGLVELKLQLVNARPADGSGYDGGYGDGYVTRELERYEIDNGKCTDKIAEFQNAHKDAVCTLSDRVVSTNELVSEMTARVDAQK